MADDADWAADVAALEADAGVSRVRAAVAPSRARECRDCGDTLSAERRHAAPMAVRCVECQGVWEGRR
jgi:phage/conjugal plasmid C-4 type zinc finger TraR family protein